MNPGIIFKQKAERKMIKYSPGYSQKVPAQATVLIATTDPEIRKGLANLLQNYSINTIWVDNVEDVKSVIVTMPIAACFCGLWLQDGTYREIVRHLRRRMVIPVVIVSAPSYPIEYRDYLSAMNIGALDCICYPYEQSHFQSIIESAIAAQFRGTVRQSVHNDQDLIQSGAA